MVFGTEGGVSHAGDVVLCSEEVPSQWSKVTLSGNTVPIAVMTFDL